MTMSSASAPSAPLEPLAPSKIELVQQDVIAAVRTVFDPEIPVNIYDLGLIYDIQLASVSEEKSDVFDARIVMTLTTPNCPVAGSMPGMVERAVSAVPELNSVKVELVFDPPWDKSRMSDEAKLQLNMF